MAPEGRRERVQRIAVPAMLIAALLAGCGGGGGSVAPVRFPAAPAGNARADWSQFGYDAQRTGRNPHETTLGSGNVGTLHLHWSFAAAGAHVADPVLAANVARAGKISDLLYVADESGDVYALDAASGAMVWHQTFPAATNACADLPSWGITGTPVVDRATSALYVVDGRGAMHALDLAAGTPLHGWPASVPVLSDPSLEYAYSGVALSGSGVLYATSASYCDSGTYYGSIVALSAVNGARAAAWLPETAPLYGGGIWGAGGVVADPRPGVTDLYVATGNAFPENAQYSDSVVRLSANLAPLAAYSQYDPSAPDDDFGANPVTYQAPACPAQLAVEQKSGYLNVYDLDAIANGPVQRLQIGMLTDQGWNVDAASYDAAVGMLFVGNATSNGPYPAGLLAFGVSDCMLQLLWHQPAPGAAPSPLSQPVIANGVVYYATGAAATVAAYDEQTGRSLWTSPPFGAAAYAAPTVVNGMVYAVSTDKHVYAFGL